MYKRIIALLTVIVIAFCAVGCSKSDAPEGMHLVSLEGEPFKLYAPQAWTSNTVSGISGAFFAGTDNIAVSARYFSVGDVGLEDYVRSSIAAYSTTHDGFELDGELTAAVLGGADAKEINFVADYEGKAFRFRQLFAKHNGDIILLSFRCPADLFETYNGQFGEMIDVFKLCAKGEVKNDYVTDKKTPDGMKIASGDALEYRFYVPETWICDTENGVSQAYVDESGRPNVSVTAYIPDDTVTPQQYFEECERSYKDSLNGYEFIGKSEREVGGRKAVSYTYSAIYGGVKFNMMQTVFVYLDRVYSITYTSPADTFESHMEDVTAILDAFRFR